MVVFLIYGITYGFSAAVIPGPFLTYLISQTLTNGWRHTLPAIFAPLMTDGPIAALMLLILIHLPIWLEELLRLLGGIFLLYLARAAWISWRGYASKGAVLGVSTQRTVLKAAMVNLLNPNPYIGWGLVLGPLLLSGWREAPAHGVALIVGFYASMIASTAAIVMAFTVAGNTGPKVNRNLIGASAIALACFGIYQMSSGIAAIVSR